MAVQAARCKRPSGREERPGSNRRHVLRRGARHRLKCACRIRHNVVQPLLLRPRRPTRIHRFPNGTVRALTLPE
jgi:hypothetical protein